MATEVSHLHTVIPSPSYPRLFLRTIQRSDAAVFASILSSPENRTDPHGRDMTVDIAEQAIERSIESASEPTIVDAQGNVIRGPDRVNMMLVLKSENGGDEETVIGLGGFGAIKTRMRDGRKIRSGDAGAMLDPAYKRRGYGTEAMKMAIGWAFTPTSEGGPQLDLVTITVLEDNEPMLELVNEKLGLEGKGIARLAEFDDDKQEIYYELKKEDWEHMNKN